MDILDEKFDLHRKWVESVWKEGEQMALTGVDFREYDLKGKFLEQAFLGESVFDGLELGNLDFRGTYLSSSSFKNVKMTRCNLSRTDLYDVNFSGANLKNIRFIRSDCERARFKAARLVSCIFVDATFVFTDFTNAVFDNVDITGATFEQTIVKGIQLKNISGINKVIFKSINIGTERKPVILEADEAKKWVKANMGRNRERARKMAAEQTAQGTNPNREAGA